MIQCFAGNKKVKENSKERISNTAIITFWGVKLVSPKGFNK